MTIALYGRATVVVPYHGKCAHHLVVVFDGMVTTEISDVGNVTFPLSDREPVQWKGDATHVSPRVLTSEKELKEALRSLAGRNDRI